ncbi:MAG: Rieske 2Fe-2S domain-containing protein [Candidatus Marsarchaeota archaeon]|jgi:nitrite reductase/ring-hydroxylating ferredoxin subunit|nr:Rieske 2Fe-2S domain-containing protein [Candidatus Marsarchaeota archaeon]
MRGMLGIKKSDLRENEPIKASVAGRDFVLVLHNGRVNALDGLCTHEQGPLFEGSVDGDGLVCPWHSGVFDIETGKANENTPWVTDTAHYDVGEDQSGELFIEL